MPARRWHPSANGAVGIVCALLATAPALANPTFEAYGRSFRPIHMPTIPPGSFSILGDALPDGRILAVTGNSVFLESATGSGIFDAVAEFDPALTGGSVDPSFVRLSPDGQHVAVGTGFAKPLAVFGVDALGTPGSPTLLGDGTGAAYFRVDHFDAAWADSTNLAITASTFGQPAVVTLLDTTSDPLAPSNPVIIDGIGGASAGIAFDSAGRLYTGNGFAGSGPSGTGWIKAFDPAAWLAGPADFEQDGRFVADVLSAATLRFDAVGNLFVGGGDFGEADTGYLAVLESSRVLLAAGGGPAIDRSDPVQVLRLDPRGDGFGFFLSGFNGFTRELYVMDGQTWYATVPSPTGAPVLLLATSGCFAWRRRRVGVRRDRGALAASRPRHLTGAVAAVPFLLMACTAALAQSPFATTVLDFQPAPGQFVNNPSFNDPAMALGAPIGGGTAMADNTKLVSLGGFGGTITLGFDHTVEDDPHSFFGLDAIVFGNAVYVSGDKNRRFAECAVIEISLDANGNGIPDDPWYLIPGTHITDPNAQFTIATWDDDTGDSTFPPALPSWIPPGRSGVWTSSGFRLPADPFELGQILENPLGLGSMQEGIVGYADHTPVLILGDTNADNIVEDPTIPPEVFYTAPDNPISVGISHGSGGGDAFDIAWAIDPATGLPAQLTGFDFIRITTGVDLILGFLGEVSTEIGAVADARPGPYTIGGFGQTLNPSDILGSMILTGELWIDFDLDGDVDADDVIELVRFLSETSVQSSARPRP